MSTHTFTDTNPHADIHAHAHTHTATLPTASSAHSILCRTVKRETAYVTDSRSTLQIYSGLAVFFFIRYSLQHLSLIGLPFLKSHADSHFRRGQDIVLSLHPFVKRGFKSLRLHYSPLFISDLCHFFPIYSHLFSTLHLATLSRFTSKYFPP